MEQVEREVPLPSLERQYSLNKERERKVAFQPTNSRSSIFEDSPPPLLQSKPREELSSTRIRSNEASNHLSRYDRYGSEQEKQDGQEDGI